MARFARILVLFVICIQISVNAKPTLETSTDSEENDELKSISQLGSVSSCPNGEHGKLLALYGSPAKCYPVGEKGPCDVGQKLFLEHRSLFGVCSCECFKNLMLDSRKIQICRNKELREYVHHPVWNKCFKLNDQGPCEDDELLVKSGNESIYEVICKRRWDLFKLIRKREIRNLDSLRRRAANSVFQNECPRGMVYSVPLSSCVRTNRGIAGGGIGK